MQKVVTKHDELLSVRLAKKGGTEMLIVRGKPLI